MIKAIITDVDGVMIGKKEGYNYPLPTPEIMQAFKTLQEKNIPIVLCTGKNSYSIEKLIKKAGLDGPHIGDVGAYIFNPIKNQAIKIHELDKETAKQIVKTFLGNNFHVSVSTTSDSYTDTSHNKEITDKRSYILERQLLISSSLPDEIEKREIIKILITLTSDEEKKVARKLIEPFLDRVNAFHNSHPVTGDWEYLVITKKGVNKKSAAHEVSESLGISLSEVLGVGDTIGDWEFIQDCGYAGIVGQKHPEVLELAKTKGEGKYFLATSVDENGLIQILEYFKLI